MTDLKAKDYRRMFLEEIGFPLIRANAERFVPEVGDLRKVSNLKMVYEVAMEWKEQQSKSAYERELKIAELEAELECLRSQLPKPTETSVESAEPENHLADYVASLSDQGAVEAIVSTALQADSDTKKTYRKLARAFHPDSSNLPKDRATALFATLSRLYEQLNDTSTALNSILENERERSTVRVAKESQLVNDDIWF